MYTAGREGIVKTGPLHRGAAEILWRNPGSDLSAALPQVVERPVLTGGPPRGKKPPPPND
jgi:hypothetical protein